MKLEWKTIAIATLGLAAAVVGAKIPEISGYATAVSAFCMGAILPSASQWGRKKATPPTEE